ncbi:hypothetical protein EJ08DRAFT_585601 [Tothia fuscella]|uniref:Rhodopsin domain-containing protein n=1 Tax=Tothia fuscella TaxID=1048955 RepID=A0A9P4NVC8_9PEZI|nr:hypothetical protein EJ08DRAFT_585601 [Tothia fuscella]
MVVAHTYLSNTTIPEGKVPIQQVPQSQATSLVIAAIVFLCLSWITVLARFWTRTVLWRSLGWDDWTMGITIAFFTVFCAGLIRTALVTCGKDFLAFEDLATAINFLIITECFYVLTMLVLKLSIAIFFLRIIAKRWQRVVVYISAGVSILINTVSFFFIVFQCGVPSSAYLIFIRLASGQCISRGQILGLNYGQGGITTLTDVVFAILPIFMLQGTNMNSRERWTVGFILLLAAVGGIASMVRLGTVKGLAAPSMTFFAAQVNRAALLSTIEPGLGIIATSLATLRPLFRSLLHGARSLTQSNRTHTEKSFMSRQRTSRNDQIGHEEADIAELYVHRDGFRNMNIDNGPIEKSPWQPAGRRVPAELQMPYQTYASPRQSVRDRMGEPQPRAPAAHDGLMEEVPVMKHPSHTPTYETGGYQRVLPVSPLTPFTPRTPASETSESPVLGYRRGSL